MTSNEFNDKYKTHLEEGHYGLAIEEPSVVKFLDDVFQDLVQIPGFQYSQVKLKFGNSRFYSTLGFELSNLIEKRINLLIKQADGKS